MTHTITIPTIAGAAASAALEEAAKRIAADAAVQPWGSQLVDEALADLARAAELSTSGV